MMLLGRKWINSSRLHSVRMRLSIKVVTIIDAVAQNVFHIQVQDLRQINLEEGGIFEGFIHIHHFHPEA